MSRDRLLIGLGEKRPASEEKIVVIVPYYLVLELQVKEHRQYTSGCKKGTSYLSSGSSLTLGFASASQSTAPVSGIHPASNF